MEEKDIKLRIPELRKILDATLRWVFRIHYIHFGNYGSMAEEKFNVLGQKKNYSGGINSEIDCYV